MLHLLLLIPAVLGASIPPQPKIPTTSQCLQSCFEEGSLVNAAFDLKNFKSIAVDIENFCETNSALLKCGRECSADEISELEDRTAESSYICGDKIEEFRLVHDCLLDAPDMVDSCMNDCGLPEAPLRLDSSPAALVNPTAVMDGIGSVCDEHVCALNCAISSFTKACPGSGDLFRDMARHQVVMGNIRMASEVSKENSTMAVMIMNYLEALPESCHVLTSADNFDQVMANSTVIIELTPVDSELSKETEADVEAEEEPIEEETPEEDSSKPVEDVEEPLEDIAMTNETMLVVEGDATVGAKEEETELSPDNGEIDEEAEEEVSTVADILTETEVSTVEPVIVIDDTDKTASNEDELKNNEIVSGEAQEVVSSSTTLMATSVTAFAAWILLC